MLYLSVELDQNTQQTRRLDEILIVTWKKLDGGGENRKVEHGHRLRFGDDTTYRLTLSEPGHCAGYEFPRDFAVLVCGNKGDNDGGTVTHVRYKPEEPEVVRIPLDSKEVILPILHHLYSPSGIVETHIGFNVRISATKPTSTKHF